MSWIAGIDLSTWAIDVVLIDEDDEQPPQWHRYELEGQDAFDRARRVRGAMRYVHSDMWDDVIAVGIEDPRGYNAGAIYRIQGAILQHIPHTILVHPLTPQQWRVGVGLPGNASKRDVYEWVRARGHDFTMTNLRNHPADKLVYDPFDAYCIALATRNLIEASKEAA